MRGLTLVSVVLILLSGCSTRYSVEPPKFDSVDDLKEEELPKVEVPELPTLPEAKIIEKDGVKYSAFKKEGMNALIDFRDAARGNTEIARELVKANQALVKSHNMMVRLSKAQQRQANTVANHWARTEEKLRWEQDISNAKGIIYPAIFLLGIGLY